MTSDYIKKRDAEAKLNGGNDSYDRNWFIEGADWSRDYSRVLIRAIRDELKEKAFRRWHSVGDQEHCDVCSILDKLTKALGGG